MERDYFQGPGVIEWRGIDSTWQKAGYIPPTTDLPTLAKPQEFSIQAWAAQKMRNSFWLRRNSHNYQWWGCGQAAVIPWAVSEPQCKAKYLFLFFNHRISCVGRDPQGSLIQLQTWQSLFNFYICYTAATKGSSGSVTIFELYCICSYFRQHKEAFAEISGSLRPWLNRHSNTNCNLAVYLSS